jgi:tetratricopeptide (TPR) repeat protein
MKRFLLAAAAFTVAVPAMAQVDCATALANVARYGEEFETFVSVPQATRVAYEACNRASVPPALRHAALVRYAAIVREPESTRLIESTLESLDATQPAETADVLPLLDELSSRYQAKGRTAEAVALLDRALQIRVRLFGPDSNEAAHGFMLLGFTSQSQEKPVVAERYFRQAIDASRKACGPRCELLATALESLASLLRQQPEREAEVQALEEASMNALPIDPDVAPRKAARKVSREEAAAKGKRGSVVWICGGFVPSTLADVVTHDRVVHVRITESAVQSFEDGGVTTIFTRHEAEVLDTIKGDARAGTSMVFMQRAGRLETETSIHEVADRVPFQAGDELVLALSWNPYFKVYESSGPSLEFRVNDGRVVASASYSRLLAETADVPVETFVARLRDAASRLK